MSLSINKIGTIKCSFEALIPAIIERWGNNSPLRTKYSPLNNFYLYLFKEYKKDELSLCWRNHEEPVRYTFQEGERDISSPDFYFNRLTTYYGYFSGEKLDRHSIELLKKDHRYKLIEIIPRGVGRIKIDNSLFYWVTLIQSMESIISHRSKLLETIINIYDDENFTLSGSSSGSGEIIKEIRKTRLIILPDGNVIDIYSFIKGIHQFLTTGKHFWESLYENILERACQIDENPSDYTMGKLYSYGVLWNISAYEVAPPAVLSGALNGFFFSNDYEEQLEGNINNFSINLLEEYLYNVDSKDIISKFKAKEKKYFPPSIIDLSNRILHFVNTYGKNNQWNISAAYQNVKVQMLECSYNVYNLAGSGNIFEYLIRFSYMVDSDKTEVYLRLASKKITLKLNNRQGDLIDLSVNYGRRVRPVDSENVQLLKEVFEKLEYIYQTLLKDPTISTIPVILIVLKGIFGSEEFYL